jgi:hypothetical protein
MAGKRPVDQDARTADWEAYVKERAEAGWCPFSGMTLVMCKRTDICDCFDFPPTT